MLASRIRALPTSSRRSVSPAGSPTAHADTYRLERVLALSTDEVVFAFSRISPDERYLAYASESRDPAANRPIPRLVRVMDLVTRRSVFAEAGIDAYWSPDGQRMIYLSFANRRRPSVSIWHRLSGRITRDVAPNNIGDYYSWGEEAGRERILTIDDDYVRLQHSRAGGAIQQVPACPEIGRGESPRPSKDGRLVSTFVHGHLVVRGVEDCTHIARTGVRGGNADFSWDGRYIALHRLRASIDAYEVVVIDLVARTLRIVPSPSRSALFPSWTRDGRLSFRYDGPDFRGFVLASHVLSLSSVPLEDEPLPPPAVGWTALFPTAPRPLQQWIAVLLWSPWSAHSIDALTSFAEVCRTLQGQSRNPAFVTTSEPGSRASDVIAFGATGRQRWSALPVSPNVFRLTSAHYQIPAVLLFHEGRVVISSHGRPARRYDAILARSGHATSDAAAHGAERSVRQRRRRNAGRLSYARLLTASHALRVRNRELVCYTRCH